MGPSTWSSLTATWPAGADSTTRRTAPAVADCSSRTRVSPSAGVAEASPAATRTHLPPARASTVNLPTPPAPFTGQPDHCRNATSRTSTGMRHRISSQTGSPPAPETHPVSSRPSATFPAEQAMFGSEESALGIPPHWKSDRLTFASCAEATSAHVRTRARERRNFMVPSDRRNARSLYPQISQITQIKKH